MEHRVYWRVHMHVFMCENKWWWWWNWSQKQREHLQRFIRLHQQLKLKRYIYIARKQRGIIPSWNLHKSTIVIINRSRLTQEWRWDFGQIVKSVWNRKYIRNLHWRLPLQVLRDASLNLTLVVRSVSEGIEERITIAVASWRAPWPVTASWRGHFLPYLDIPLVSTTSTCKTWNGINLGLRLELGLRSELGLC